MLIWGHIYRWLSTRVQGCCTSSAFTVRLLQSFSLNHLPLSICICIYVIYGLPWISNIWSQVGQQADDFYEWLCHGTKTILFLTHSYLLYEGKRVKRTSAHRIAIVVCRGSVSRHSMMSHRLAMWRHLTDYPYDSLIIVSRYFPCLLAWQFLTRHWGLH